MNWFRTDENGKFLWPGYGENSRVLKWVFERCDGTGHAVDTPIGRLPRARRPRYQRASTFPLADIGKLLNVDVDGWLAEIPLIREHFAKFGSHLPEGLNQELEELDQRLHRSITRVGKMSRFHKVTKLGKRSED